jgi:RNA polymerase sigma factor (sigma-70 family)
MKSEKELLDDIKKGDRSGLHQLYSRYVGYAMAVGLRYVPDRDDLNDVIQDSFVKILSSVNRFEYRGEGSLKGWILRIVSNEAINFIKQKTKFSFVDEFPDEIEEQDPDVDKVPPQVLNQMISELPDGYRMVLNLYVFEQKSHKEIAEMLDIKESTSASQYLRAKKLLASKINNYLRNKEYE